jgi:hypothetical protein
MVVLRMVAMRMVAMRMVAMRMVAIRMAARKIIQPFYIDFVQMSDNISLSSAV